MIRVILRNIWYATLAAGLVSLIGCSTYTPAPPLRPEAAPVSTTALSAHLDSAEKSTLSAAARRKRVRQLLAENDKLIKSFP